MIKVAAGIFIKEAVDGGRSGAAIENAWRAAHEVPLEAPKLMDTAMWYSNPARQAARARVNTQRAAAAAGKTGVMDKITGWLSNLGKAASTEKDAVIMPFVGAAMAAPGMYMGAKKMYQGAQGVREGRKGAWKDMALGGFGTAASAAGLAGGVSALANVGDPLHRAGGWARVGQVGQSIQNSLPGRALQGLGHGFEHTTNAIGNKVLGAAGGALSVAGLKGVGDFISKNPLVSGIAAPMIGHRLLEHGVHKAVGHGRHSQGQQEEQPRHQMGTPA